MVNKYNISIVKKKLPTHYTASYNLFDITDLIITSPDLIGKIINLKVPKSVLHSDHFPMIFQLQDLFSKHLLIRSKYGLKPL